MINLDGLNKTSKNSGDLGSYCISSIWALVLPKTRIFCLSSLSLSRRERAALLLFALFHCASRGLALTGRRRVYRSIQWRLRHRVRSASRSACASGRSQRTRPSKPGARQRGPGTPRPTWQDAHEQSLACTNVGVSPSSIGMKTLSTSRSSQRRSLHGEPTGKLAAAARRPARLRAHAQQLRPQSTRRTCRRRTRSTTSSHPRAPHRACTTRPCRYDRPLGSQRARARAVH